MQLLDRAGAFRPALKILTDYPRDDLAHDEVHQALVAAVVRHGVDPVNLDVGSIPGLDTVTAGFKTAQLALNSTLGYGHVFHVNCAPRKNMTSVTSKGEGIVLGMTASGVAVLAVNAGYTLSFFHDLAAKGEMSFFETSVPDAGSQFRSRDFFPDAMAALAAHLSRQVEKHGVETIRKWLKEKHFGKIVEGLSFVGTPLAAEAIVALPAGAVSYIDNFGNIKTNFKHKELLKHYEVGEMLAVRLGNSVCDAVMGDVGFSQGEGLLALTSGSSGWGLSGNEKEFFTEIFLRGGRAERSFKDFQPGDHVILMRETDLQKVTNVLRMADRTKAEELELYNISGAKIMAMLSRSKLIRHGYDTTALQKSLADNTLLEKLRA